MNLWVGETDFGSPDPAHAANPSMDQGLSLIGRVVIDRELPFNAIRANVLSLINPVKEAILKHITANKFVIKFNHELDRQKALRGCPWVLEKHALLLEPVNPSKKPVDQNLTRMNIVVRVMLLSLQNRSENIAKLIENKLGEFIEVPKDAEGFYSTYFRNKVALDVSKPVMQGLYFQGVEGTKQWLQVAYERLPVFCFLWGIIGYGESNCPLCYEDGYVEPEGEFSFGSWLRTSADSQGPLGEIANGSRETMKRDWKAA